jgi:hypothetical protein
MSGTVVLLEEKEAMRRWDSEQEGWYLGGDVVYEV